MKTVKRAILLILIVILLLIVLIIVSLPFMNKRDEGFYYRFRVQTLKSLLHIAEYNENHSLLVADSLRLGKAFAYPYDKMLPTFCSSTIMEDINYYQKVLRYKIIKTDNWWGIIELEYGIIGKYFLMITKDGDIVRFDKPFLPEQKLAEYPPKYDISKHIYPAYLDTIEKPQVKVEESPITNEDKK